MKYGVGGTNNNQNLDMRVFILPPQSLLLEEKPVVLSKGSQNLTTSSEVFIEHEDEEVTVSNLKEQEYNTLCHYLAMHDDLYCTLVYQQFAFNPLLRDIANQEQQGMPWQERIGLIEGCSILQDYLD